MVRVERELQEQRPMGPVRRRSVCKIQAVASCLVHLEMVYFAGDQHTFLEKSIGINNQ